MPSFMEFDGKDIENAAEKAIQKLDISKKDLKYDVLSYGSTGIFGLVGSKKARIRVTLPETAPKKNANPESPDFHDEKIQHQVIQSDDNYNEAISLGKTVLKRIIDEITTDATITVQQQDDRVLFNITGENAAILIGKRGQTLEAIQYLIEKAINRQTQARIRVQVDIEGYLENRKTSLMQLAARMAQKAVKTGRPASVGQMNAHDRRIVHLALQNDGEVRTQSVGNGFYRKLVIFPQKKQSLNQKSQ